MDRSAGADPAANVTEQVLSAVQHVSHGPVYERMRDEAERLAALEGRHVLACEKLEILSEALALDDESALFDQSRKLNRICPCEMKVTVSRQLDPVDRSVLCPYC